MNERVDDVLIVLVTGTIALLLMALFSILFILYYHRRQRETIQEKKLLRQNFERELLQAQLETQNQTLQQIGEELHDHIGQLLTVAIMRLNDLEDEVTEPNVQQSVQQTRDLVSTIIQDVRTLSKTLDYDVVKRFGLVPSLTLDLERIQRMGRIQTQLVNTGEPYLLDEQAETVLLRMVQESLNNALKHAQAQKLTVSVDYQPTAFTLTITDDGRGFSVKEATARTLDQTGSGLSNLNRRAGLLGGTCIITSRPNEGTRVEIRLPRHRIA